MVEDHGVVIEGMLPILIAAQLLAAGTTLAPQGVVQVSDDDGPDFVERYFPLQMDKNLDPQVEDLRLLFFLGGLLPFGQVWLPLIAGLDVDDSYLVDALIIAAIHLFPHLALAILIVVTPIVIVPVIGLIIVGSVYLLNAINLITFLANNFYFTPVAIVNEANRHVARGHAAQGRSDGREKKPKPRRKKKNSSEANSEANHFGERGQFAGLLSAPSSMSF